MMKLDASSKIISVKFGDEEKVISGRACTAWKIATGYESYGATALRRATRTGGYVM